MQEQLEPQALMVLTGQQEMQVQPALRVQRATPETQAPLEWSVHQEHLELLVQQELSALMVQPELQAWTELMVPRVLQELQVQ